MAALTAADLLSPTGPVESFLFPEEDSNVLEARLTQYLANAYADERVAAQQDDVRKNGLARNWALNLVYTAVYTRLSSEPATLTVTEKGGHGYSTEQIRNIKSLADKYWNDFLGLLVIPPALPASQLPGSISVRATVDW